MCERTVGPAGSIDATTALLAFGMPVAPTARRHSVLANIPFQLGRVFVVGVGLLLSLPDRCYFCRSEIGLCSPTPTNAHHSASRRSQCHMINKSIKTKPKHIKMDLRMNYVDALIRV